MSGYRSDNRDLHWKKDELWAILGAWARFSCEILYEIKSSSSLAVIPSKCVKRMQE